jgi:hypothetical protein
MTADISELRRALGDRGDDKTLVPGDPGYDEARTVSASSPTIAETTSQDPATNIEPGEPWIVHQEWRGCA